MLLRAMELFSCRGGDDDGGGSDGDGDDDDDDNDDDDDVDENDGACLQKKPSQKTVPSMRNQKTNIALGSSHTPT